MCLVLAWMHAPAFGTPNRIRALMACMHASARSTRGLQSEASQQGSKKNAVQKPLMSILDSLGLEHLNPQTLNS